MILDYILYLITVLLSIVVTVGLALYGWRQRPAPAAQEFSILMGVVSAVSLASILGMISPTPDLAHLLLRVGFAPSAALPLAWLMFVLEYTGHSRWLTSRRMLFMALVAGAAFLIGLTNPLHHLMWRSVSFGEVGALLVVVARPGVLMWAYGAFAYLVFLSGVGVIMFNITRSNRLYRQQSWVMFLAAAAPMAANLVYAAGLLPQIPIDFTPFGFLLSGIACMWGLFRYRLFDLVPVGRDAMIERMSDGMLLVDRQGRIMDLNPAAAHLVGQPAEKVIGRPLNEVFRAWSDVLARYQFNWSTQTEFRIGNGLGLRHYDLRIMPMTDRHGRLTGRLVVLRDITERKRIEEARRMQAEELAALYSISSMMNEVSTLEELARRAASLVGDSLYSDLFAVALLNSNGMLDLYWRKRGDQVHYEQIPAERGVIGRVLQTGNTARIGNVRSEPLYHPGMRGAQSELCVPILSGGRAIGALNAESLRANQFTENDERMLKTVAGLLSTAVERLTLFENIRQMAINDPLTGIFNRRHFFTTAVSEYERARRHCWPIAVLMIDLDGFKEINDTCGHAVGDRLLTAIAHCMKRCLRQEDALGRYGGDEFAVLLPQTLPDAALAVARRLLEEVARLRVEAGRASVGVTMSVGVSSSTDLSIDLDMLLYRADEALYQAKQNGGNQAHEWQEE